MDSPMLFTGTRPCAMRTTKPSPASSRRISCRSLTVGCFLLGVAFSCRTGLAQTTPDLEAGLKPYGSYDGGKLDTVNLGTGNLTLHIPILSYPQRGKLNLAYDLVYNAESWHPQTLGTPTQTTYVYKYGPGPWTNCRLKGVELVSNLAWCSSTATFAVGASGSPEGGPPYGTPPTSTWTVTTIQDLLGGSHQLAPLPSGASYPAISVDTSGIHADANGITTRDGTYYGAVTSQGSGSPAPGGMHDIYGNAISSDSQGNTVDSTGRVIPPWVSAGTGNCPAGTSTASSWTVPSYAGVGGSATYTECFQSRNIATNYTLPSFTLGYPHYVNGSATVSLLTAFILPNGTKWQFDYNGEGDLFKLTLPTGGSISYTWTTKDSGSGGFITTYNSVITSRTLDPGDGSPVATWHYNISPGGPSSSVTDPMGNVTTHAYAIGDGYDTNVSVYNGSASPQDLVKSTDTSYSYQYNNADQDATLINVVPTAVKTTWASGAQSLEILQHDSGTTAGDVSGTNYNGEQVLYGNTIQVDEYGFGTYNGFTPSGAPLKTTKRAWEWQQNSAYLTANLLDLPASTQVLSGGGQLASYSTYTYDEAAYGGGYVRGMLTTEQDFANASSGPVTHTGWDYHGMKLFTIDADANGGDSTHRNAATGHTIDYGYDPSGSCANSEVTSTTNALNQRVSGTYDCNTGLLNTLTDTNGNSTTFKWDSMHRLTDVRFPAIPAGTPETSFQYVDSSNTVTRTVQANPDPAQTTTVVFDGLGRETHRTIADTPQSDLIDTTYDLDGRVRLVSNPYRSTSDSTYGQTAYTYDALDRKTIQVNPDGTTTTWCYNGSSISSNPTYCSANVSSVSPATWIDSSDEAGHHSQHVSDALGRLVAAVEPSPTTGSLALQTIYSYDTLGNLLGVNQHGASGETPRIRSFGYGMLSWLLWSNNPETGAICYGTTGGAPATGSNCAASYDPNGNVLAKTDARGQLISYSYDPLNRLKAKTNSYGTVLAAFGYDGLNYKGTTLSSLGFQSAFSVGKLSETTNVGTSAVIYSYDPAGHLASQQQYLQSSNNWSTKSTALYDLVGNVTDLTYPDLHHVKQTWDTAGRLSTSNLVDVGGVSHSESYLQSASYLPDGSPSVVTLGNGVQQFVQKNNRLQVQSRTVSTPFAPFNGNPFLSLTYCYVNCTSGAPVANNGNIGSITDTLSGSRTQGFTYDALNRISSFLLGGTLNQQYAIDSFGNLSGVVGGKATTTFDPSTNRTNNLPCSTSTPAFDAAGNQTCDSDPNGGVRVYGYNEVDQVKQIATSGNTASPFETYAYLDGIRVRKSSPPASTFTEYVDFGGQR